MTDDALPELLPEEWILPEHCPLCDAPASTSLPFETSDSDIGAIEYLICGACGFVYQAPHPSQAWLRRYYQGGYHLHMHGQQTPGRKTEWVEARRAGRLLEFASSYLGDVRCHLDIGSSMGHLLATFRERFGCQSHGVEPADEYRQNARERGVDVVESLSGLDSSLANGFDLVSLSHVLEHLNDPIDTLHRLHRDWMADDAHLLVEVPNLFGHPSLELSHLFAFSPHTLIRTLRGAGFQPIATEIHGHPHSRRLPFYVRTIARRLSEPPFDRWPPPPVTRIRLRRRLGMLRLRAVWAVSSRLFGRARLTPWAS